MKDNLETNVLLFSLAAIGATALLTLAVLSLAAMLNIVVL